MYIVVGNVLYTTRAYVEFVKWTVEELQSTIEWENAI